MYRERPLLVPLLGLIAGLAIADQSGMLVPFSFVAAAFCCLLLSCFIRGGLPMAVCIFGFFLVWGMYALTPWRAPAPSTRTIQRFVSPDPVIVEGIITSRPAATPVGSSFVLRTEAVIVEGRAVPVRGAMMVYVSAGDVDLARGDRVRLAARCSRPCAAAPAARRRTPLRCRRP